MSTNKNAMGTDTIPVGASEIPKRALLLFVLLLALGAGTLRSNAADTTPPNITCGKDKTVPCGNAWAFDIPTAKDEVDGNNVLIEVVATVTNAAAPRCPAIFSVTRTWRATDTSMHSSFCNQTVTIVDTEPPRINCAKDKNVQCGTDRSEERRVGKERRSRW